ncbi:MAG: nucleotidyltransferase family protein [Clostridia bacterium]|nr:nucleotidyltransferase family protein [Clostridia bacterium]
MKRSDKLSVTGIIAEFNPLHKGHEYLIKEAKKSGPVICVISGNFVQRGDTAIAEKRIRAKAALMCGADLVLELPVLWSMSTAQNFALGGVSALYFAGCDKILFGSECGDIQKLYRASKILNSPEFSQKIEKHLSNGITFASARQIAGEECGIEKGILNCPNNNLGIEYISAALREGYNIEFETVSRRGAAHDSLEEAEFVSASLLRQKITEGDVKFCEKYMPENVVKLFSKENISEISRIDRAILASLRTKSVENLKNLPDLSEGLENKLFSAIRVAKNCEELYNSIKVKRYTHARVRRLCLSAFLGMENNYFMKPIPYLRVLGFNATGKELLGKKLSKADVPVIVRSCDIDKLSDAEKAVFKLESRATDLFGLTLEIPYECGLEHTAKIIDLKDEENDTGKGN